MLRFESYLQVVVVICVCVGVSAESSENNSTPVIYRREILNESMEKIEVMDNGVVTKSAFVPMVPQNESSYSLERELLKKTKIPDDKNNKRIDSTELMALKGNIRTFGGNSIVSRNGKKYRLIKVKKNSKRLEEPSTLSNQIEKRSFKLFPNWLSMLPVKWMTRNNKKEQIGEEGSEDGDTQWSRLHPIESTHDSREVHVAENQGSEKIKKLLNLFTIVKFDNGECYANGLKGSCLHPTECEERGGQFTANCAGDLGVCCYFERTCDQQTKENCTYFVNEGFPDSSTTAPRVCTLTVDKADPGVRHLRLDFLNFQLREPVNGTCLHDKLVVTGQDTNDIVPEICGANTGQHIYVDVEDSSGPFSLNVITVGEYFPRNFRIKVTQIKKTGELPPKNCLQYYTQPTGYIQTFNYQQQVDDNLDEIVTGYFNNLNYAICIKKHKGFCSITYENEEPDNSIHPTFQLVNVDEDGEKLLPPRQAGAETFDCPDDYIVVNGIRLCGEKLNDAFVEIDFTRNYPVTDMTNGPFVLSVRTDATVSGRGFYLKYTQNPCFH